MDETRQEAIRNYCLHAGWMRFPGAVSFLAAGEYNENWLVETGQGLRVFRINHGSQLGLGDGQIAYEHRVLELVRDSGVTPLPYGVDPHPQAVEPALPGGVLLMEYIPGVALDYTRDAGKAARIFAAVHSLPVPCDSGTQKNPGPHDHADPCGLVVQADPVGDIVRECEGLLARFPDHPRQEVLARLLRYRDEVARMGEESRPLFAGEPLCIVNTEVNSGNFLISEQRAALVDWEKAVLSCRHQDLGHFLAATTTLWKTDYVFDAQARAGFLREYCHALHEAGAAVPPWDMLDEQTRVLERTILLRGLSWCYMAWYEYTRPAQPDLPCPSCPSCPSYLSDLPDPSDLPDLPEQAEQAEQADKARQAAWAGQAGQSGQSGQSGQAGRALTHAHTLATIERYLDGVEWLLR